MEEKVERFWRIYDAYIQTENEILRKELSELLAQIEKSDRAGQLIRPEKGWNKIIAWQVLRSQKFFYPKNNRPFFLDNGEILTWSPGWDRDVFLTRIPYEEHISGGFLNPGYYLECNQKEMSDSDWGDFVDKHIFTDERGLYLPLYEFEHIIKLANSQIEKAKKGVIDYLILEKGYKP